MVEVFGLKYTYFKVSNMAVLERVDFVYLTPALLCFTAFLAGIVPCALCLDSTIFAYISLGIFVVSLVAHTYILFHWKRYKGSSPFAYAITQPVAHLIIMVFALCVGSVNVCSAGANRDDFVLQDNYLSQHSMEISEVIARE